MDNTHKPPHTHTGKKEQMGHGHSHTDYPAHSFKSRPFMCIISRAIIMKDGVTALTHLIGDEQICIRSIQIFPYRQLGRK